MGKFEFTISENLAEKLSKNLSKIPKIAPSMLEEAAPIVAKSIKKKSPKRTGCLEDSVYIKKVKKTKNGAYIAKVGFDGYEVREDSDKCQLIPNALKAAVAEFGSSNQQAQPFIRPAVAETEQKVVEKMQEVFNREVEKP